MTARYRLPVEFQVREAIAHPNPLAVVLPHLKALCLALWRDWQEARRSASHS